MKQELERICAMNPENLGAATPQDFLFKYIDISSVEKGCIHWDQVSRYKFSEAPSRARRRVKKDDVLLCTVRPGLQAHARISNEDGIPFVASTGFAALRPYKKEDSSFVFHQIFSNDVVAQLRSKEVGSSYPAVNESDVRRLSIFMPEPSQRKAIGKILNTVDEAIAQSGAVIAKLKQVRAGMLHDLLSYGLDEHGQLRDPVAHPEQFKDSPLGLIPREWDVFHLQDIFDLQTGATPSRQQEKRFFAEGNIPWVKTLDLNENWIHRTDECITEDALVETSCHILPTKTILIAMYGGWEQIGRTGILGVPATTNQAICALTQKSDTKNPEFIFRTLQHSRRRWKKFAASTRKDPNISKSDVAQFLVSCPKKGAEQVEICRLLANFDSQLKEYRNELKKLCNCKIGLQDDLLTGRVRVPETIMEGAENA